MNDWNQFATFRSMTGIGELHGDSEEVWFTVGRRERSPTRLFSWLLTKAFPPKITKTLDKLPFALSSDCLFSTQHQFSEKKPFGDRVYFRGVLNSQRPEMSSTTLSHYLAAQFEMRRYRRHGNGLSFPRCNENSAHYVFVAQLSRRVRAKVMLSVSEAPKTSGRPWAEEAANDSQHFCEGWLSWNWFDCMNKIGRHKALYVKVTVHTTNNHTRVLVSDMCSSAVLWQINGSGVTNHCRRPPLLAAYRPLTRRRVGVDEVSRPRTQQEWMQI